MGIDHTRQEWHITNNKPSCVFNKDIGIVNSYWKHI